MIRKNNRRLLIIFTSLFGILFIIFLYYNISVLIIRKKDMQAITQFRNNTSDQICNTNTDHFDISDDNNTNSTVTSHNDQCYVSETTKTTPEHNTYSKNNIINVNETNDIEVNNNEPSYIDCILKIPSIDLEKPVYTGVKRTDKLAQYELITAAKDMQYKNKHNYIICGHASRVFGHSFNRLKELKKGTTILIESNNSISTYIVKNITYKEYDQCNEFFNQTQSDSITILSCARYVSDKSYIIIQAEKE